MANTSLAVLESALRAKKLDATLTTALAPLERTDASAALVANTVASGIRPLDEALRGGLPRGQLSEIAGPHASGRTTLLLSWMAAALRRGEIAALIDPFDRFDVPSAAAAGIDLDRLLWIRGHDHTAESRIPNPESPIAIDRALKALNLVLQAGGFAIVALDLADDSMRALTRIPFTTWLRVQRTIEGSDTACVLLVRQPLARSAGGVTLALSPSTALRAGPSTSLRAGARWMGASDRSRRLAGLDIEVRVISPRRRVDGEVAVAAMASSLH